MFQFQRTQIVLRGWIAAVIGLFLLTACGTATPQPSAVAVSVTPLAASATRTLTLFPSQTPTPAVPAVIQTDLPQPVFDQNWWRSPDGQWLVEDLRDVPGADQKQPLSIRRVDGTVVWKVRYTDLLFGDFYRPLAWSPDGNFVYISFHNRHAAGSLPRMYCNFNGIQRVDLRSGVVEPFVNLFAECSDVAVSPDGLRLAYTSAPASLPQSYSEPDAVLKLMVLDFATERRLVYTFSNSYNRGGALRWSPDQKQILAVAAHQYGSDQPPSESGLFLIGVGNDALVAREVFKLSGPLFVQEWQGNRVMVNRSPDFNKNEPYWEVNPDQAVAKALGPTLTPSRTPRPSATPAPHWATPLALTETVPAVIRTDLPNTPPGDDTWGHSPDGQWLFESYEYAHSDTPFKIVRADGKVEWKVNFLGPNRYGMDRYRLAAWSPDGNFAYIAYNQTFRDGGMLQYCQTEGIWRLDLHSGQATPFLTSSGCWNYAFSPDARWLAYILPASPEQLVVMDLNSGKKLTYKFDPAYVGAGLIRWSPDQAQLILVASRVDPARMDTVAAMKPPAESTLFWVKIEKDALDVRKVFSQVDYLYPREWKGDHVVVLQEKLGSPQKEDESQLWYVVLISGVAIQIDPTPQP